MNRIRQLFNNFCLIWFFSFCFSTAVTSQTQSTDSIRAMGIFNLAKTQINTNSDSSIYNFDKAARLFKALGYTEYYLYALNNLSQGYLFEGQIGKASEYIDILERLGATFLGDTSDAYASLLYTQAGTSLYKGNVQEALRICQKSIDIFTSKKDLSPEFSLQHSYDYQLMSICYEAQSELDLAVDHIKRGLKVIEEAFGKEHLLTVYESAIAFTNLGELYYKKGDLDIAKEYLDQALYYYHVQLKGKEKEVPELVSRKGILYLRLSTYYEDVNADSMLYWANLALNLPESNLKERPVMAYNRIGLAYEKKGLYPQARTAFRNGIKYLEGVVSFEESYIFYGNSLMHLARMELAQGNNEEGLQYAQLLLNYFAKNQVLNSFYENPEISTVLNFGYDHVYNTVKAKAQTFHTIGEEEQDEKQLLHALANYDYVIELAKEIRHHKWSEGAKFQGADRDFELYEGAIATALELYELTEDEAYIDRAFGYSEQSKAALLQESIDEVTAKEYGGIPDSLLSKERGLRVDLAYYNKVIAEEKRKPSDQVNNDRIEEWEDKLFEVNSAYYNLIDVFESDFPKYFALKYQAQFATVEDVQSKVLDRESAMLSFFAGESRLYVFVITKEEKDYIIIEDAKKMESEVQDFVNLINQPSTQTAQVEAILQSSHSIYEGLLRPALESISYEKQRLIIIPDNWLSYLPMETLVSSYVVNEMGQYDSPNIEYLFEDYIISYGYSCSLLLKNLSIDRGVTSKILLGIAPSFESPIADVERNCSSDELYSLHCSQEEVQQLNQYFSGKNFLGESATKDQFLESASDFQIIHLATHACVDSENPMLNKIFFTDDYLTSYDLYGLQLNAELAVLSACNTGSGQLVKGEGVMSLSKGFIHAGVPSTVTSLWSVDDCATSTIMASFYQYLEEGLRKDEALREAKLDYLAGADKAFQHPYYWGGFVQIGNPQPLSSKRGVSWTIVVSLSIGAILFFLTRRRKKVA